MTATVATAVEAALAEALIDPADLTADELAGLHDTTAAYVECDALDPATAARIAVECFLEG